MPVPPSVRPLPDYSTPVLHSGQADPARFRGQRQSAGLRALLDAILTDGADLLTRAWLAWPFGRRAEWWVNPASGTTPPERAEIATLVGTASQQWLGTASALSSLAAQVQFHSRP